MKRENIVYVILGMVTSLFAAMTMISMLYVISYEPKSPEFKFCHFMLLTNFTLTILMIPVGWLLDKRYAKSEPKEIKLPLKKIDYIIYCLIVSGLIMAGISIIGFSFLTVFIPFEELEQIRILNVSLPNMVKILIYVGVGMNLIGISLILAFYLRKPSVHWLNLANFYFSEERYEEALNACERSLKMEPTLKKAIELKKRILNANNYPNM